MREIRIREVNEKAPAYQYRSIDDCKISDEVIEDMKVMIAHVMEESNKESKETK